MPRINRIASDANVQLSDKLLGTDSSSGTRNFTIEDISKFFSSTNAAGIAGQLTYEFKTSAPFGSGTAQGTFSSPGSVEFQHLTNLKVFDLHQDLKRLIECPKFPNQFPHQQDLLYRL